MTSPYLWDDHHARRFAPFALTRPVGELRAGAALIRERWERLVGAPAGGFVGALELADFEEAGAPPSAAEVPAGAVLVNSRCVPSLAATLSPDTSAWLCGGRLAAIRLSRPLGAGALLAVDDLESLPEDVMAPGDARELEGRWLDEVWDLIGTLGAQLAEDVLALGPTLPCVPPPAGVTVLGTHPVFVEEGAAVEPLVVLDATAGPILLRRQSTVSAFTRLTGPVVVGEGSTVLGGRLQTVSIGEHCKVHGEVSTTVFLAYSNKAHDGFVGHSYLARWVNLGAGTTTSNLKNTYGTVHLWTPDGVRDTGLQFLGTLFGDHAKTGIGLRLTTGAVLGAGANVFDQMPPKHTPPFSWGGGAPYTRYELDKFLAVAERMMARRHVPLGERMRRQLGAAHAATEPVATR